MGRRCKCRICGTEGRTSVFHKVVVNGKNQYYCNEEEYDAMLVEETYKNRTLEYISNHIWIVDDVRMLPNVLRKKLNELAEIYNHEVIYSTVLKNKDDLAYWMGLENKFNNDYGKASYMVAIIKGNINQEYQKWKRNKIREEQTKDDNNEAELLNEIDMNSIEKKPTERNILDFM